MISFGLSNLCTQGMRKHHKNRNIFFLPAVHAAHFLPLYSLYFTLYLYWLQGIFWGTFLTLGKQSYPRNILFQATFLQVSITFAVSMHIFSGLSIPGLTLEICSRGSLSNGQVLLWKGGKNVLVSSTTNFCLKVPNIFCYSTKKAMYETAKRSRWCKQGRWVWELCSYSCF